VTKHNEAVISGDITKSTVTKSVTDIVPYSTFIILRQKEGIYFCKMVTVNFGNHKTNHTFFVQHNILDSSEQQDGKMQTLNMPHRDE